MGIRRSGAFPTQKKMFLYSLANTSAFGSLPRTHCSDATKLEGKNITWRAHITEVKRFRSLSVNTEAQML